MDVNVEQEKKKLNSMFWKIKRSFQNFKYLIILNKLFCLKNTKKKNN